jgi:hypothetical protein
MPLQPDQIVKFEPAKSADPPKNSGNNGPKPFRVFCEALREAIFSALENFKLQCKILGWKLIEVEESSILGKEGNKEYILHFKKDKK